ncbi:carbohydrate ABC transporter permease [Paenibacillaceae bacterium]|nr:carbohydrate ABC transporter permease [Paenibacillaceae bacterium]
MKAQDRGIISAYDLNKPWNRVGYIIMVIIIVLASATMIYPILVTFFNAFKPNHEVISFQPTLLPKEWVSGNFTKGWNYIPLTKYMKNTLMLFGGNMLSIMVVLGLAAFSLSKLALPNRRLITLIFMTTLFIPPTTYIIPNFLNLKDLGLLNSFWAFWIPASANAFFLLLLKTFFDGIHNELFEASRIDGASEFRSFVQIAVPLSIPIFATLAIFTFATSWNDWFWPSLVMHSDNKYPLATAIYNNVIDVRRLDLNIRFAILSMVSVPPIVVFLLFQRYIMRGLHLSGVKG